MADESVQYYLLFGCRTPFRGWLTTTGWLSQRRRESNFFSRRQQLRREFRLNYSARFPLSFSTSVTFFYLFFLPFFLLPSLLHWLLTGSRNFTQCVRSCSSREPGCGPGRGGPQYVRPAPLANDSRALIIHALWANHIALQTCITGSVTATGQGKRRKKKKTELESVERRGGCR